MKWSKRFNHSRVQFIHIVFFGGRAPKKKKTTQKWLSAISLVWNRITLNSFLSKVITKILMLFMCSFNLNSSLTRLIFFIACYSITKVFLPSLPSRWIVQTPRDSSKSLARQERGETSHLPENQCTGWSQSVRGSLGNQDYSKQTR